MFWVVVIWSLDVGVDIGQILAWVLVSGELQFGGVGI